VIPVQITDYVERTLALLVEQFKGKPRFEGILSALATQIQDIENATFQLFFDRALTTAVGAQLDQIGTVVGLARNGLSDSDYRAQLGAQVLVNTSQGDPERLIEVVRIITSSALVVLAEPKPGYVQISFDGTAPDPVPLFVAKIDSVAPAGVRLQLVEGTPGNSFRLGTVGDVDDPLRGLADALDIPDHGGKLGAAL